MKKKSKKSEIPLIKIEIQKPDASENTQAIIEALQKLISISTAEGCLKVIQQHPVLLTDEADAVFEEIMAKIKEQGDEQVVTVFQSRWEFLKAVRETGQRKNQAFPFQEHIEQAQAAELLYLRGADLDTLNKAIGIWEHIITLHEFANASEVSCLQILSNSANTYLLRYQATGMLQDLNRAISLWEQTVTKTPENSPDFPIYLNNLGTGLSNRYLHMGNLSDIEEAIKMFQMAASLVPENSPDFPLYLNNSGNGLKKRYLHVGNITDLEEGIEAYKKAVSLTLEDSPDLPGRLNNLGNGLRERHLRMGNLADLEEGIKAYQKAVLLTPEKSPDLPIRLSNLGNGLTESYLHTGNSTDLEEGIKAYQKALLLTPENSPDLPAHLSNLGTGLRDRYLRSGNLTDLEEGLKAYEQALALTPENSPDLPIRLSNLGEGLWNRYSRLGNLRDLEQGIKVYQETVALTPESSPDLPRHLNNLGTGLADRYLRLDNLADLEEAIEAYQKAMTLTPENSPDLPNLLTNLGNGLRDRYSRMGSLADLEQGIKAYQKAVALTPENSSNLPVFLTNLGAGLNKRYLSMGYLADIEEAIEAYQKSVALTPENSPDLPSRLNNLGNGLTDRYLRMGNPADLEEGIKAYHQATEKGLDVAIGTGLVSARNWLNLEFERQSWKEVEQVCCYAYQATEHLLKNQLLRDEKETWLKEVQGIAAQTAYALAKLDKLHDAVIAIENGQARLLSESLAINRTNLEQISQTGYANLFEEYQEAVGQIRHRTQQAHLDEENYEKLKAAQARLDSVIQAIQQIKGCEKFLASPDFADIQDAAKDTLLVYIITTNAGGLALIVMEHTIWPAWLPDLTDTALREKLVTYITAYSDRDRNQKQWRETIDKITHWMWQKIMQPVIKLMPSEQSKIMLIPAGLLNLLPLHAAWTEDSTTHTGRRYALDFFTISYTPNARALTEAKVLANKVKPDRLLAIADPRPADAGELPNSEYEAEAVSSFFEYKILKKQDATRESVLKALPDWNVLHFSCHGCANFEQPADSGLLMAHNEFITLKDLLNLRLKGARMAVMSACETGIPGTKLPDEIVNLPSGLLQAGVAGVVASLWSVSDLSAMMLMTRFYYNWQQGKLDSAEALQQAQIWVRDSANREKLEYFRELENSKKYSRKAMKRIYRSIGFSEPEGRDFAHPYHWAAFQYVGA